MHLDPTLPKVVVVLFVLVSAGMLMRRLGQPGPVAYILAGTALGPHGLALVQDLDLIKDFGAIGVVLLLFFVGLELSLEEFVRNWKVAIFGTLLQIAVSTILVFFLGKLVGWPVERSLLLGFVVSLSSTAMVLRILQDRSELDTRIGRDLLSILIVQDLALIPMLLGVGYLSGQSTTSTLGALQVLGSMAFLSLPLVAIKSKKFTSRFFRATKADREMQVFIALLVSLGLAYISGLLGLSTALGAFVGGLVVATTPAAEWFKESLHSFRILFVALFFASVGFLVDFRFMYQNITIVLMLVGATLIVNTILNTSILRWLGRGRKESLYGGALLAPIGEFSFVLASIGLHSGLIENYAYQITILMICITIVFAPFWATGIRRAVKW